GQLAVYASSAECHAVCAALDPGTTNDHTQNTLGCRFYHSYNALSVTGAPIHCPHTGPGGDGHCGADDPAAGTGNCVSYCKLAEKACPNEFASAFPDQPQADSHSQCVAACGGLPGAAMDSTYSQLLVGSGNTVQYRLGHVAAALLDSSQCAA